MWPPRNTSLSAERTINIAINGYRGVVFDTQNADKPFIVLEHRAGIEPANTDFADQRVSHFAIGAS